MASLLLWLRNDSEDSPQQHIPGSQSTSVSLVGLDQCFRAQSITDFPSGPCPGVPGPGASEPAAQGLRAFTPEITHPPSPPGEILAFQIHLNCPFEAEPSRSPISCSASSRPCSHQSPGVWKVFTMLSSVQIFVAVSLSPLGLWTLAGILFTCVSSAPS